MAKALDNQSNKEQNMTNEEYNKAVDAAIKHRDSEYAVAYDITQINAAINCADDEHLAVLQEYAEWLSDNAELVEILCLDPQYLPYIDWNQWHTLRDAAIEDLLEGDDLDKYEWLNEAVTEQDNEKDELEDLIEVANELGIDTDEIESKMQDIWEGRSVCDNHPDYFGEGSLFRELIEDLEAAVESRKKKKPKYDELKARMDDLRDIDELPNGLFNDVFDLLREALAGTTAMSEVEGYIAALESIDWVAITNDDEVEYDEWENYCIEDLPTLRRKDVVQ